MAIPLRVPSITVPAFVAVAAAAYLALPSESLLRAGTVLIAGVVLGG